MVQGMSAVDAIRKDLKRVGRIEPGTVVKFVSGGEYTYAALFVAGNWWLTGSAGHFTRTCSHAEFIERVLSGPDITDVQVATAWEFVK